MLLKIALRGAEEERGYGREVTGERLRVTGYGLRERGYGRQVTRNA